MSLRDAFGVARAASELAVNVCYIGVAGTDAATKAERHALQKAYRDMSRSGTVGGISVRIERAQAPDPRNVAGLEAALAEFTGKKGQEISDWTPLNLSARIDEVRKVHPNAALSLTGATTSIYRHSSDLLHGTYFGVVHFWTGSGAPATSRAAFEERWEEHMLSVFTAAFFSAKAVIELYSELFALPELGQTQKVLLRSLREHVEAAGAASPLTAYSASVQSPK